MLRVIIIFCLLSIEVHASKIGQVIRILKSECPSARLAKPELIALVRDAFLTCESHTTIRVHRGCQIPCLKENMGNVVGSSEIEWD